MLNLAEVASSDWTAIGSCAVSVVTAISAWYGLRRQANRDDQKQSAEQGRFDRDIGFAQLKEVNDRLTADTERLHAKDADQAVQINALAASQREYQSKHEECEQRFADLEQRHNETENQLRSLTGTVTKIVNGHGEPK